MSIRPIKTAADHRAAIAEIERLWDAAPGSDDADTLEVLAVLADAYENEHVEIPPPDPIDAILFRMEQRGAMEGDRERCLEAGMDAYVSKPVRMDDLLETIDRLLSSPGKNQ